MSQNSDRSFSCDRCGAGVGGGGVATSTVISTLDPDTPGVVRTLNLCLDRTEDGRDIEGCSGQVLTADALAHYHGSTHA